MQVQFDVTVMTNGYANEPLKAVSGTNTWELACGTGACATTVFEGELVGW